MLAGAGVLIVACVTRPLLSEAAGSLLQPQLRKLRKMHLTHIMHLRRIDAGAVLLKTIAADRPRMQATAFYGVCGCICRGHRSSGSEPPHRLLAQV